MLRREKFLRTAGAVALAISLSSATPAPSAASSHDCSNLTRVWVNLMGSKLEIQSVDATTGLITGRYQTASGAGGWFPLTGWLNQASAGSGHHVDNVIGFSVRWGSYGSITSWTGACEVKSGTPTISTLWHLVRPNSDYQWDHILTNADVFMPK